MVPLNSNRTVTKIPGQVVLNCIRKLSTVCVDEKAPFFHGVCCAFIDCEWVPWSEVTLCRINSKQACIQFSAWVPALPSQWWAIIWIVNKTYSPSKLILVSVFYQGNTNEITAWNLRDNYTWKSQTQEILTLAPTFSSMRLHVCCTFSFLCNQHSHLTALKLTSWYSHG